MSQEKIARIVVHTDTVVKGFFGDYRWLSNFHPCKVVYRGLEFSSSESAYQSAKQSDPYIISLFQKMSGFEAKKASKNYPVPANWNSIKNHVMYDILSDKFTRNPDVRQQLIETGEKYLEETNYWNDTHFGVCNGVGKNHLGEILMKIRKELIDGSK